MLELLKKELPKKKSNLKAEFTRLGLLVARVANVRKEAFKTAEKYTFDTCGQVVDKSSTETALEVDALIDEQRRNTRESFFGKELTDKQKKAILGTYEINGKTILDWMKNWEAGDIERIASACQKASVKSLSVADIVKKINGTRAENYEDGILSTTRKSATMMARTLINGVSNNTRMETIKANSDVIDGIKFLGTLDGKTCSCCAQFDGRIWELNEIASVPRPPIHPNCRSAILPWIQLKDAEGNDIDLEYDRPAANADFDKRANSFLKYDSAIQIILENAPIIGTNHQTGMFTLIRTENNSYFQDIDGNIGNVKPGEQTYHNTGVCESHSHIKTVAVKGHDVVAIRVPFSRIHGLWFMERKY